MHHDRVVRKVHRMQVFQFVEDVDRIYGEDFVPSQVQNVQVWEFLVYIFDIQQTSLA